MISGRLRWGWIAGLALAVAVGLAAARTDLGVAATYCAPVEVIDSRGSGETGFSGPGTAFQQRLKRLLAVSVAIESNPYPAVSVFPSIDALLGLTGTLNPAARLRAIRDAFNGLGAYAHRSWLGAYHASVTRGKSDLKRLVLALIARCPGTYVVLTGYSQGAEVTGDVFSSELTPVLRAHIAGVVLFGDPLYRPGSWADRHPWPRTGILGERVEFPADSRRKVLSYCHQLDPVCQAQIRGDAAHKTYASSGDAALAAALIAARLRLPHGS